MTYWKVADCGGAISEGFCNKTTAQQDSAFLSGIQLESVDPLSFSIRKLEAFATLQLVRLGNGDSKIAIRPDS